jgi:hypothetical protein
MCRSPDDGDVGQVRTGVRLRCPGLCTPVEVGSVLGRSQTRAMCTTSHKVLYAGAASHVSRSFECTIHVFGWAGFPTTALSCPRAIAFTTALRGTQAACAAWLIDRYPATGRRSSTGPRAFRCMPLSSAPLYLSFTRRVGERVVSPPARSDTCLLIGGTTLGGEMPPRGQSWPLFRRPAPTSALVFELSTRHQRRIVTLRLIIR